MNTKPWYTHHSRDSTMAGYHWLTDVFDKCVFSFLSKKAFLNLSWVTRGNWCIHCLFITQSRCAVTQRQSDWLRSSEDSLCLCKYIQTHTGNILRLPCENRHAQKIHTYTQIHIGFFVHWKPLVQCRCIHARPYVKCIHMQAYIQTIKDKLTATGTHTAKTLISTQVLRGETRCSSQY